MWLAIISVCGDCVCGLCQCWSSGHETSYCCHEIRVLSDPTRLGPVSKTDNVSTLRNRSFGRTWTKQSLGCGIKQVSRDRLERWSLSHFWPMREQFFPHGICHSEWLQMVPMPTQTPQMEKETNVLTSVPQTEKTSGIRLGEWSVESTPPRGQF